MNKIISLCLAFLFVVSFSSFGLTSNSQVLKLDLFKSFIFNDIKISNKTIDPNHPLSFVQLFEKLDRDKQHGTAEQRIEKWLELFANGSQIPGSHPMENYKKLLESWPRNSIGQLDFTKRNFVLNMVINRLDGVSDFTTLYKPQLRLEYQLFDIPTNKRFQALYILEIPIDLNSVGQEKLKTYAHHWASLSQNLLSLIEQERILTQLVDAWVSDWKRAPTVPVSLNSMDFLDALNIDFGAFCMQANGSVDACLTHMMLTKPNQDAGSSILADWFKANHKDYLTSQIPMPADLQGHLGRFTSKLERILPEFINDPSEDIRNARANFVTGTCIGCHNATERNNDENLMNIERESLNDTPRPTDFVVRHEIPKRKRIMEELLAQKIELADVIANEDRFRCQALGSILGQSYAYGEISVPLDYSIEKNESINFGYYRRAKAGGHPLVLILDPERPDRTIPREVDGIADLFSLDLVVVFPRGTGCSSPMPVVRDQKSAVRRSHYNHAHFIYDLENLRKKLFSNQKWSVLGLGSSAAISDRYVATKPKYLKSVVSFGGQSSQSLQSYFIKSINSQLNTQTKFFDVFPKAKEAALKLRNMLNKDKCIKIDEENRVCGTAILSLLQKVLLNYDKFWPKLSEILINAAAQTCPDDRCLFAIDKNLNPKFLEDLRSNNFPLFTEGKRHFDMLFSDGLGGIGQVIQNRMNFGIYKNDSIEIETICRKTKELLRNQNPQFDSLYILDECELLSQIAKQKKEKFEKLIDFKRLQNPRVVRPEQVRNNLEENKELQYIIAIPGRSTNSSYLSQNQESAIREHAKVLRVPWTDSDGYILIEEIWQTLSKSPNQRLFPVELKLNLGSETFSARTPRVISHTKKFSDLLPNQRSGKLVYVGKAASPLDQALADQLKGNFAFIDRGDVAFLTKLKHVEAAGAVGAIIANNQAFPGDPFNIVFDFDRDFDFAGYMISTQDGDKIRKALQSSQQSLVQIELVDTTKNP